MRQGQLRGDLQVARRDQDAIDDLAAMADAPAGVEGHGAERVVELHLTARRRLRDDPRVHRAHHLPASALGTDVDLQQLGLALDQSDVIADHEVGQLVAHLGQELEDDGRQPIACAEAVGIARVEGQDPARDQRRDFLHDAVERRPDLSGDQDRPGRDRIDVLGEKGRTRGDSRSSVGRMASASSQSPRVSSPYSRDKPSWFCRYARSARWGSVRANLRARTHERFTRGIEFEFVGLIYHGPTRHPRVDRALAAAFARTWWRRPVQFAVVVRYRR